ncbi:MAG: HlyD family efflux transporter periplasmic adaptor subunit [Propionibacteriaceae bacterium]|nr:HlyD family efflux transporter periplasmic adaptor subunit [Propionibacteriaceae bacterium]
MSAEQPVLTPVKRKARRRWIVPVTVAAVVVGGGGVAWGLLQPRVATVVASDVMVLTAGTLTDSISATGTVAAASTTKIFSTLTYQVTAVNVEVGDDVSADQVLAQLDTRTLTKQITSKKASMTQSQAVAAASLASAQHKASASRNAVRSGKNPSIVSAQSSVTAAHANWTKATKTYEDFADALDDGQNSQLVAAQTALDNAKANLTTATYNEQKARDAWMSGGMPDYPDPLKVALDQAVNALDAARTACRNARDAYDATDTTAENTLSDLKAAARQARDAYTSAKNGLSAAQASAQTEVQSGQDAVTSSQASGRQDAAVADLAGLLADRASATIASPVSGTITAVYATLGAPASGVLFVVESTDRLEIASSVNEYDVNTVTPGMKVLITADGTRDAVSEGTVTSVAPASTKDAAGQSITGSDIQYPTTVDVTSLNTGLKIGMNARLQYVVSQQDDVLSVPLDAVYANAQGSQVMLALAPRPDGKYTVQEVPVTLGLETDVDVAISGGGVQPGLRVLTNPTKYRAGSVVALSGA